jgi:putative FmdB family regulatory protein
MPTYEYRCTDCGHEFEEFQLMTEPPLDKCPECGGRAERVISGGAGFLFKGSGFYITDYRSESYKKAAEKDKPSPAESSTAKTSSSSASSSSSSSESSASPSEGKPK